MFYFPLRFLSKKEDAPLKNTLYSTLITLIIAITLTFTTNTPAQDSPQWRLPDGATARFGKGTIHQITYSPDSTKMAVATSIGIWIYDTQTGDELNLLSGHLAPVRSIAFHPDGNILASGSSDRTVRLWDVNTGIEIRSLTAHKGSVYSVAFSHDGTTLASGSYDRTVRLWDTDTGTEIHTLTGHTRSIDDIAFNHDSTMLASAALFENIRLWDVATGTEIRTFAIGRNSAFCVAFSPNNNTLAAGGHDETVRLWDADTGTELHTLRGHTHHIRTVAFSPDGNTVASNGGWEETIRLWHVTTGTELHTLTGHTYPISSITFHPSGDMLASGSSDDTIRLWDVATGTERRTFADHSPSGNAFLSTDTKVQATRNIDYTIRLWDAETGMTLHTLTGHTDKVISLAFSPDRTMLVSGSDDRSIRLWDVATGTLLHTLKTANILYVEDVAFSPDGKKVAGLVRFMNSSVYLYDVETGERVLDFTVYRLPPLGRPIPDFLPTEHSESVRNLMFSPDGKSIVTIGYDDTIRFWDTQTGTHQRVLRGHTASVNSIRFSPDGTLLASSSSDDTIRLWDVESGMMIRTLIGHTGAVYGVTFSPDGATLASGSFDFTIRLWDVESGMTMRTITGHKGAVYGVMFSPDGETLASRSTDGTTLVWDLTPTVPINTAVRLSPANVTSPEVGENLVLSLKIAEGQNVAGYQATVSYDNTALRYVESANSDYLNANAFSIPTVTTDNSVTLAVTAYAEESNGDGTLATLTYEVVAVKASTVSLSNVILTDSIGSSLKPQTAGTEIVIPTYRPEDVNKDGVVNINDLMRVASHFGYSGARAEDVNDDGIVNIIDLTLVAAAFDSPPAAPGFQGILSRNLENMPTRATVAKWLNEARQLNLSDPDFQRGLRILEQLLASFTPKETVLLANYPNPFNPETWIPYQLATPADVSISIYGMDGKLVRTLDLGHQPVGIYRSRTHAAHWDGKNALGESVASGVYFYTFKASKYSATRKMLIRK